jgi:predicted metal-dependent enzyme (double-stranded beta helix superfamily)
MSEFHRYVTNVAQVITSSRDDQLETALAVKALTLQALASPEFIVVCADRIVSTMESAPHAWRNPPLRQDSSLPLQIRVFYWPPGQTSDPHFHGRWTVTGVLLNSILVETFESNHDAEANRAAKRFTARSGDVGHLMPPCIHRLTNTTDANSATLHVFNEQSSEGGRRAGMQRSRKDSILRGGAKDRRASPIAQRSLEVVTSILARTEHPLVIELLARMFELAVPRVQLQVIKTLVTRDAAIAHRLSQRLERSLNGAARDKLAAINEQLAQARGVPNGEGAMAACAGTS